MPSQTHTSHHLQPHRSTETSPQDAGQLHPLRGPISAVYQSSAAAPDPPVNSSESCSPTVSRIDLKAITSTLMLSLSECPTRDAARSSLIRLIRQLLNPTTVHLWRVSEPGLIATVDSPDATLPSEEIVQICQTDIQAAVRRRGTVITDLDRSRNLVALSLPIGRNVITRNSSGLPIEATEVLTVILLIGEEPLESFLVILQLLCGYLTFWELDAGTRQLREYAQIDQFLLKTIVQMTESGSAKAAARVCVEELRNTMTDGQAAIGVVDARTGATTLLAVSGAADIDDRSDLSKAVRGGLEDALQRDAPQLWKPDASCLLDDPLARLASQTGSSRILTGPFRDIDNRVVGSWVVYGSESIENLPIVRNVFVRGERALARIVTRQGNWGRSSPSAITPVANWRRWRLALAGLAITGGMFVPAPYRVVCNAQIQPQSRRFVAAPFAGVLRQVYAETGDLVQEGDLLAEMDETELKLELAELQAEVERLTRTRDVNRAESKEVEAVLDGHKLQQAQARLDLLTSREQHLQIRSPIHGVILSEDLKRAQGLPVRIGQSLFEVAPLDKMRLELSVPADQVSQIEAGQSVQVSLISQPSGSIGTAIKLVLPNAETVDGEHVFLALADMPETCKSLRPGENGTARVEIGKRPAWWILFHRPWQKLRTQWGW